MGINVTKWRSDALISLLCRYTAADAEIILEWFDNMRGSDEYELTGLDFQVALQAIRDAQNSRGVPFDLHGDLMTRLWAYAPLILKSHG